jgi:hypothetical protein
VDCADCVDCVRCADCVDCADCVRCVGIANGRDLRHVAYGVQLTAEQWDQLMGGMD